MNDIAPAKIVEPTMHGETHGYKPAVIHHHLLRKIGNKLDHESMDEWLDRLRAPALIESNEPPEDELTDIGFVHYVQAGTSEQTGATLWRPELTHWGMDALRIRAMPC